MNNIYESNIDFTSILKENILSNIFLIIIIWLIGMSVIGIPIIIFTYFTKVFCLGFSTISFIAVYKSKGIIFSLLYLFPNELVKLFIYTLLVYNSINVSKKFLRSIFKKEIINFNKVIKKYFIILMICIVGVIITSLYETYAIPFIFNKLYFLIK